MNNDVNIIFHPNIGLGKIQFFFQEKEIIDVLGIPDKREIDIQDTNDYVLRLFYIISDLSFYLHYEDNKFIYMSIHLNDVILEELKLTLLSERIVIDYIKDYHEKNHYIFLLEESFNSEMKETCYYFESIGLTIWYEDGSISDICVQNSRT